MLHIRIYCYINITLRPPMAKVKPKPQGRVAVCDSFVYVCDGIRDSDTPTINYLNTLQQWAIVCCCNRLLTQCSHAILYGIVVANIAPGHNVHTL